MRSKRGYVNQYELSEVDILLYVDITSYQISYKGNCFIIIVNKLDNKAHLFMLLL